METIEEGWRLSPQERGRMQQEGVIVEDPHGLSGRQWQENISEGDIFAIAAARREDIRRQLSSLPDIPV